MGESHVTYAPGKHRARNSSIDSVVRFVDGVFHFECGAVVPRAKLIIWYYETWSVSSFICRAIEHIQDRKGFRLTVEDHKFLIMFYQSQDFVFLGDRGADE